MRNICVLGRRVCVYSVGSRASADSQVNLSSGSTNEAKTCGGRLKPCEMDDRMVVRAAGIPLKQMRRPKDRSYVCKRDHSLTFCLTPGRTPLKQCVSEGTRNALPGCEHGISGPRTMLNVASASSLSRQQTGRGFWVRVRRHKNLSLTSKQELDSVHARRSMPTGSGKTP